VNTIPFGPRNPPEDPLLAKAAELPKDIAPARDLWPGIAARLGEAEKPAVRPFRWPLALAAGVLVAAVSALFTWTLTRAPVPSTPAVIAQKVVPTDVVPVNYGPNSGLSAKDLGARDELLRQFRGRFADLRPETRAAIVKNLEIMQKAANDIDAALAKDPASGMLKGMLVGTYKQELQLYSTVVTAGDGLTRRI